MLGTHQHYVLAKTRLTPHSPVYHHQQCSPQSTTSFDIRGVPRPDGRVEHGAEEAHRVV